MATEAEVCHSVAYYLMEFEKLRKDEKESNKLNKEECWKGDINRRGTCLVEWKAMCRTKKEGGLNIVNLENQNSALLMKFLDKFFNHAEIPWVQLTWSRLYSHQFIPPQSKKPCGSFWWKDVLKLFSKFREFALCKPRKGNSSSLWLDNWSGQVLQQVFPQLFSFPRKKHWSLKHFMEKDPESTLFLPLSAIAEDQLAELDVLLNDKVGNPEFEDSWEYFWGPDYFPSKAYKHLQGKLDASPIFLWIWKSGNLGKHKFFA